MRFQFFPDNPQTIINLLLLFILFFQPSRGSNTTILPNTRVINQTHT